LYKGVELTDDRIPEKAFGFIYLITHKESNRRYIGRKLLSKSHTRRKAGKVIRSRVESDWKTYWSSSPELLQLVETEGEDKFIREVLVFAPGKALLNYLEEKFLYYVGALETEEFFNSNIRSKMYKRNIIHKFNVEEVNSILKSLT
jgi:hypothetical protein